MTRAAIHALMVNYNQPHYCENAIKMLVSNNHDELATRRVELNIHWIDNSGTASCLYRDRAQQFSTTAGIKWHVHRNPTNLGFGQACQRVFSNLEWSDFVLLINPDTELSGLAIMHDSLTIANDSVAGIGPKSFWDIDKKFLLPPTWLIDENFIKNEVLSRYSSTYARYRSRLFRDASIRIWTATKTIPIEAVSGACGLFRVDALHLVGGLFDKAFFMYWEDTELMLRLKRADLKMLFDPQAHLIHYYEHTAAKSTMIESGRDTYLSRLELGSYWKESQISRKESLWPIETIYLSTGSDLRIQHPRPSLHHRNAEEPLWELGFSEEFVPSIGTFSEHLMVPWHLIARVSEIPIYIRTINDHNVNCWRVTVS